MKLTYAAPMELIAVSHLCRVDRRPDAIDAATSDKKYFETGIDGGTGPTDRELHRRLGGRA